MTAEVPAIAGRPVPVACAPGAGLGSPACYLRDIPVIEVDGDLLEADPDDCDPAIPADRERYPVTWGALIHECAHAAHTQVRLPPRAARELVHRPPASWKSPASRPARPAAAPATAAGCAPAPPSSSSPTSPPPAPSPPAPREAGAAAALLLAREDAGILEPGETAPVTAKVEAAIGTDASPGCGPPGASSTRPPTTTCGPGPALARRWCRILGLDPDAAPPAPVIEIALRARQGPRRGHRGDRRGGRRRLRPAAAPLPARRRRQARAREGRPRQRRAGRPRGLRPQDPAPGGHRHPRPPRRGGRRRPPPHPRAARGHRRRNAPPSPSPPRSRPAASAWARPWPARPSAPPGRSRPPSPSPAPAAAGSPPRRCESASPATSPAPWAPSPARSPRPPGSSPAPPGTCPPP